MNPAPFRMAQAGFGSQVVRTDRDNEYEAFLRVTRQLQRAHAEADRLEAIRAANNNIQLWTILAADLMHPENRLPAELKAGLISLALFSMRHSHKIILGDADLEPLIDVNTRIMKGLRGEGAP